MPLPTPLHCPCIPHTPAIVPAPTNLSIRAINHKHNRHNQHGYTHQLQKPQQPHVECGKGAAALRDHDEGAEIDDETDDGGCYQRFIHAPDFDHDDDGLDQEAEGEGRGEEPQDVVDAVESVAAFWAVQDDAIVTLQLRVSALIVWPVV